MACRCVTAVMTTILLVAFPAFSQPSGSNELGMNSNISTNVTINGEDIDIADFGFIIPNGTISGCVWNDTPPNNIIEEGDGIMESGEEGLKGVNVSLYDGETETLLFSIYSNDTGHYLFEVPYGRYTVKTGEGPNYQYSYENKRIIKIPPDSCNWWPTKIIDEDAEIYSKNHNGVLVVLSKDIPKNTTINFGYVREC